MSHQRYLDEPAEVVDWTLALANMEAEMEQAAMERERKKAEHQQRMGR